MRKFLNKRHLSLQHPLRGLMKANISSEEFVNARDKEFIGSCKRLGVLERNTIIPKKRACDGDLSVNAAKSLILDALAYIPNARVRTFFPCTSGKQHDDHTNLGIAALELYQSNDIADLRLFVEPYIVDVQTDAPSAHLSKIQATGSAAAKLKEAAREYGIWDPKNGRYAIGEMSIPGELRRYLENPLNYCIDGNLDHLGDSNAVSV